VPYLICLIVSSYFEDKYIIENSLDFSIGQQNDLDKFMIFDIIKLIIVMIFMLDNIAYVFTFGLKKRIRLINFTLEMTLIIVIITLTIIKMLITKHRFTDFYFRFLDILLIVRKVYVSQMLFQQNEMKEEFNKLNIE